MRHLGKVICLILALVLVLGSFSFAGAATKKTQTVKAEFMGVTGEVQAELTDPSSLEVDVNDYYKYMTELEIGNGLTIPMEKEEDYDEMLKVATSEAIENNERQVQKKKARRLDKEVLKKAEKEAKAKAKENFEYNWTLINEKMELPKDTEGTTKTYMNYKTVTAKGSRQYALLNSKKAYTKDGFRMYEDCYCVALGSFYSKVIGTKFEIELSTGKKIKCILGDQKSDRHTDENHQYAVKNKDIVEFIIDDLNLPGGDVSVVPGFEGSIVKITKICEPVIGQNIL